MNNCLGRKQHPILSVDNLCGENEVDYAIPCEIWKFRSELEYRKVMEIKLTSLITFSLTVDLNCNDCIHPPSFLRELAVHLILLLIRLPGVSSRSAHHTSHNMFSWTSVLKRFHRILGPITEINVWTLTAGVVDQHLKHHCATTDI
jgi:hypothetical protein